MQEDSRSIHSSPHEATIAAAPPQALLPRAEILHGIPLAPTSAAEAFEILSTVSERLRAQGDPRAVFPDVYAIVTRRVRDSLSGAAEPLFLEPRFISRLAGRFCELYLAALRRSLEREPEHIDAWAIADAATGAPAVLPIQHAILGLNAHINFDLAIGLCANVVALGGGDEAMARYRHDHDAVNRILREAIPEVMELLATRYGCPASRVLVASGRLSAPLYEAALVTLTVWRTRVWSDLLELLAARDARERSRVEARMNLRSSLLARVFRVRSPLPAAWAARARDAARARSAEAVEQARRSRTSLAVAA